MAPVETALIAASEGVWIQALLLLAWLLLRSRLARTVAWNWYLRCVGVPSETRLRLIMGSAECDLGRPAEPPDAHGGCS